MAVNPPRRIGGSGEAAPSGEFLPGSMFWVYVLYSKKLDRLYVGQTQDLKKRLAEHLQGDSFCLNH